ncbi:MAG: MgtC/SapB family protein [Actinomycetota bacterium]|nr:MgtC/SapB family protein [Actinomycetota bacterium]
MVSLLLSSRECLLGRSGAGRGALVAGGVHGWHAAPGFLRSATLGAVHASDLVVFGHIALAAGLGFVLGFEREVRSHVVGGRTFAVVATAAAAVTAIGVNDFPTSAEKVIAGIITGIGFLGAGLVLHTPQGQARGLTSAASVWAVAALGILAGAGHLLLAAAVTALLVLILEIRYVPGLSWLDSDQFGQRFRKDPEPPTPRDPTPRP